MESIEQIIDDTKNPLDIINICFSNSKWKNMCIDNNSYLWDSLVKKYYLKYYNNKKKDISIKDYYVLLYYSELYGLLEYLKITDRAQKLLHILPKIYDGDIITILNACCNIAITSNKCNIVLYRSKLNNEINYRFGSGYLRYQYLITKKDIYINESELCNFKRQKDVNNILGGYIP